MADSEQNKASEKKLTDLTKPIAHQEPPYRVLSMDGGGIYGTFTAIMLRKLWERNSTFLADDQITLFAGTSAGAINALLLAKHEDPREAIRHRVLEKFFKDERVYSNKLNPITGALSLLALTSWSGKADFYSILEDHFGDMRMKDLKHRVMITAFNFRGAPEDVFGQYQWRPKMFYNFPGNEKDRELYVKDVAYGAASPPTLRSVKDGIIDGGFFASDPSTFAITRIVSEPGHTSPGQLLDGISVLSLGVGAMIPNYFLDEFDFGLLPFNLLPTNAMQKFFETPLSTFAVNPDKASTTYQAKQLLGADDYFRLDPPVIGFPVPSVINAAYLSRFYVWRQFILNQIYQIADSNRVAEQIDKAAKWIEDHKWVSEQ